MNETTIQINKEGYFFTPEQLNEYTQKVIKQALKTATENVQTKWNGDFIEIPVGTVTVNKESIINTFEETFKKFKV